MRAFKWPPVILLVVLCFGCARLQREVNLTINSEPLNAKIYEEGKFLGNAPLTLTYKYEFSKDEVLSIYRFDLDQRAVIGALMRSRSFTAMKDGFEPQTKSFQFVSPRQKEPGLSRETWDSPNYYWQGQPEFFTQPNFELYFLLEPREATPQQPQQQSQQQQQTVVVIPGVGSAAKAFGALTIITTPAQAEIYIDGSFVATTPVSSFQVEAGTHKIEILKGGYKTWARTMMVSANSPVKIEIDLEKI